MDAFVVAGSGGTLYFGKGEGRLAFPGELAATLPANDVALGDLDGDGDLDAFLVHYPTISGKDTPSFVWLNDGTGHMATGHEVNVRAQRVALGDLDGDGDLDAMVAGGTSGVLLNDGKGNFGQVFQLPSLDAHEVALGDLDGDHDLDAVFGSETATQVWRNDGHGAFTQVLNSSLTDSLARCVVLGKLDEDDDLDLFTCHDAGDMVWLNKGDGTFSLKETHPSTDSTGQAGLFDVDGDGDLDVYKLHDASKGDEVWLNDGKGTFTSAGARLGHEGIDTRAFAFGDIDGDKDIDAYVGDEVWVNDGKGHFSPSPFLLGNTLENEFVQQACAGDLNGDKVPDLYIVSNLGGQIWLNDGKGRFAQTSQVFKVGFSGGCAIADIDSDSDQDIIGGGYVLLNDGTGQVTMETRNIPTADGGLAAGDVNHDGHIDFCSQDINKTYIYLGDGAGNFTLDTSNSDLNSPGVALVDVDGDGDLDCVDSGLGVLRNDGGGLWKRSMSDNPAGGSAFGLGDLDGNGSMDAVMGPSLWSSDGKGGFVQTRAHGFGVFLGLLDVDADGDMDALSQSGLWLNNGKGAFTQTGTAFARALDYNGLSYGPILFGDFNADGKVDLFVGRFGPSNDIWLNVSK
jgi:hypothetical protein